MQDLLQKANVTGCACGRIHRVDIDQIIVKWGAIDQLPQVLAGLNITGPILVICDNNTLEAAANQIVQILKQNPFKIDLCILHANDYVVPDEITLEIVKKHITCGIQILLAVGAGTINDITRYVAFTSKIPYISIPTAPSVDGFASTVSALIINGLKKTLPASPPVAIIADTSILMNAPDKMKVAGICDLLGKSVARLDWHLASIITGEYFCEYTADLVQDAVQDCLDAIDVHRPLDKQAIAALMEGLIISGLAISMVGNSRPASGSEHHISHFLELKALDGTIPHFLHGESVAIGTKLMTSLYRSFFQQDVEDIVRLLDSDHVIDVEDERVRKLENAYGNLATEIIARRHDVRSQSMNTDEIIAILTRNWDRIKDLVEKIVGLETHDQKEEVNFFIRSFSNITSLNEMFLHDAMVCSKEMRDRYTLLSLLDDLSILEYYISAIKKS